MDSATVWNPISVIARHLNLETVLSRLFIQSINFHSSGGEGELLGKETKYNFITFNHIIRSLFSAFPVPEYYNYYIIRHMVCIIPNLTLILKFIFIILEFNNGILGHFKIVFLK